MSQTMTFREVAVRGSKRVKCANECGATFLRSRKFWQTLNPFNENAVGEPKNREEIQEELFAERRAWMDEPETCKRCQTKG